MPQSRREPSRAESRAVRRKSRVNPAIEKVRTGEDMKDDSTKRRHIEANAVGPDEIASGPTNPERGVDGPNVKFNSLQMDHMAYDPATKEYAENQAQRKAEAEAQKAANDALERANNYAAAKAEAEAESWVKQHYNAQHRNIQEDGGFASKNWVRDECERQLNIHKDRFHEVAAALLLLAALSAGRSWLLPGSDLALLAVALLGSLLLCIVTDARTRKAMRREMDEREGRLRREMEGMERRLIEASLGSPGGRAP